MFSLATYGMWIQCKFRKEKQVVRVVITAL